MGIRARSRSDVKSRQIRTRNGALEALERERITAAIVDAMLRAGGPLPTMAGELADAVCHFLDSAPAGPVDVESLEDMVETVLRETGHRRAARTYRLGREQRALRRGG